MSQQNTVPIDYFASAGKKKSKYIKFADFPDLPQLTPEEFDQIFSTIRSKK